jgi:CRISPR-associated protein Cst1
MPGLPFRFVGHPMVDVGVATLCAAAGVNDPRDLTPEAVEAFGGELIDLYLNPAMAGFLGYVVFANARFANPAQLKPEYDSKRRAILVDLMNQWKPDVLPSVNEDAAAPGEECIFSGDPAKIRVSRMYIPLTTDEKNINFVPEGVPRMPVAGWCLLALLAMPMGGLASMGKMWIVHSYDPEATLYFAKRNLERNRNDFQMQGLSKRPNYKFARTHLLRDLSEAQKYTSGKRDRYPLTAYLFTSSGQKSDIEITHLPSRVIRFVRSAKRQVPEAWDHIVRRAERLNAVPENKDGAIVHTERNYFYEDLFDLPASAHAFLRRYLLRTPLAGKPSGDAKNDPRFTYSFIDEANLVSWPLTELFLLEVMNMDKERIEAIKAVAERLAEYIHKIDERLFKELFNARGEYQFRLALLKADKRAAAPLFTLDEFVLAFFNETDQETLRLDWMLARDLMMIHIIDHLYRLGAIDIAQNAVIEEAETEA